ncbi:hypothetical protein TcasGA2_TC010077 [Tribolium castaneum]|uniref:Uncharacterized protein n=1 Tax=Tribolium castaneum TaxID=7070 RepID=D6WS57_TRICA|nr:hypothetical protein TcasGA2_TC010077 [Tribolium castaneum]
MPRDELTESEDVYKANGVRSQETQLMLRKDAPVTDKGGMRRNYQQAPSGVRDYDMCGPSSAQGINQTAKRQKMFRMHKHLLGWHVPLNHRTAGSSYKNFTFLSPQWTSVRMMYGIWQTEFC